MTGKSSWEAERAHLKFAAVFCLAALGGMWCLEKFFGWVDDRDPWVILLATVFAGFLVSVVKENRRRRELKATETSSV